MCEFSRFLYDFWTDLSVSLANFIISFRWVRVRFKRKRSFVEVRRKLKSWVSSLLKSSIPQRLVIWRIVSNRHGDYKELKVWRDSTGNGSQRRHACSYKGCQVPAVNSLEEYCDMAKEKHNSIKAKAGAEPNDKDLSAVSVFFYTF